MFFWKAIYKDGTSLSQYNSDKTENKYTDIRRDQLSQFLLIDPVIEQPVVVIHFVRSTQKLIYRIRTQKYLLSNTVRERVWLVGWQENRNGVNVQMLCYVFRDGHVEIMDRFREDIPLYNAVKFRPEERVE